MAPALLAAILNWLRAGYPDGVPESDYIPLFALLSRRLSTDQVRGVAKAIIHAEGADVDNIDIGVAITKFTNELPREEDIDRVRSKLAAASWPPPDSPDPTDPADPSTSR